MINLYLRNLKNFESSVHQVFRDFIDVELRGFILYFSCLVGHNIKIETQLDKSDIKGMGWDGRDIVIALVGTRTQLAYRAPTAAFT